MSAKFLGLVNPVRSEGGIALDACGRRNAQVHACLRINRPTGAKLEGTTIAESPLVNTKFPAKGGGGEDKTAPGKCFLLSGLSVGAPLTPCLTTYIFSKGIVSLPSPNFFGLGYYGVR